MTISDFDKSNMTLQAPSSMEGEDCRNMPVMKGYQHLPSGASALCIVSCWSPTEKEREAIANGEDIYLHVTGKVHPPVLVSTEIHAEPAGPVGGDGAPGPTQPPVAE